MLETDKSAGFSQVGLLRKAIRATTHTQKFKGDDVPAISQRVGTSQLGWLKEYLAFYEDTLGGRPLSRSLAPLAAAEMSVLSSTPNLDGDDIAISCGSVQAKINRWFFATGSSNVKRRRQEAKRTRTQTLQGLGLLLLGTTDERAQLILSSVTRRCSPARPPVTLTRLEQ